MIPPIAVAPTEAVEVASGAVRGANRSAWWQIRLRPSVAAIVIALVTFAVFSPALWNDFVEWDDPVLYTGNEAYRGLGWSQVRWMFTTVLMGHYVPITWLTLGLDYVVWGMNPAGYHLTNVIVHAINAALFFAVAVRLFAVATGFTPAVRHLAAVAAALFFAVHPLRAESVAWVTERRDVVSGLFFFATLLLYLRAVEAPGRRRRALHAAALGAYVLAILSKSIVMSLPVLLVILDLYPLRRLGPPRAWTRPPAIDVWREKVPYVALGVVASMLGYYGQAANRYFTSLDQVGWLERPALVAYSLWFYVSKTAFPLALAPLYEMPARVDPFARQFVVAAIAIAAITAGVLRLARRWPAGLAVWASYVVAVAPVTGVFHAGHQLAHDRYSYLSCLSFALLVGGGVGAFARLAQRGALQPLVVKAAAVTVAAWVVGLGILSWQQTQTWRDTDTLWRSAVEANPACSVCELNLGVSLFKQNLLPVARAHFERALDHRPDRVKIHQNIGLVHAQLGDLPEAIAHFQKVVAQKPDDVATLMNLGVALMKQQRYQEGLLHLRRAFLLRPNDYLVLSNLGIAMTETGRAAVAVGLFRHAIEVRPDAVEPRQGLVVAQAALGHLDAAETALRGLAALNPDLAKFLGPMALSTW